MEISNAANQTPQSPSLSPRAQKAFTAARQFEELFLNYMVKSMRKTVGSSGLIEKSFGEKMYTELLDKEYAGLLSKSGNFGITEMLMKQLGTSEEDMKAFSDIASRAQNSWSIDHGIVPGAAATASKDGMNVFDRVKQWQSHIGDASKLFNLDMDLLSAMIAQESGGNRFAVSRAGAKGLMQLMDGTARDLGVTNVFDARENILSGSRYYRQMLDRFDGNERLALASYNAGPAAVEKYGGIPPYKETEDYVERVLSWRDRFSSVNNKNTGARDE